MAVWFTYRDFNHDASAFHYTDIPNPAWRAGDGLSPRTQATPQDVYDAFDKSRTAEGQEKLFSRLDPAEMDPPNICRLWAPSLH